MHIRRRIASALLVLLLGLPVLPATAQDAPPHEGEGGARRKAPAAKPAPASVQTSAPAPAKASVKAPAAKVSAPAAGARKAAPAKAAPAKAAKGPAVKNDGKPYLRSLDQNHDGRISREEFLSGSKKRFAKADANHDGAVSPQEAKAVKGRMLEKEAKNDAKRKAAGKPVKPRRKGDKPPKPYLSTFDKNHDGRVTQKEYLARRDQKFAEMDLNHDGVISREEARVGKQKLLERRAQRKVEAKERRLRKIEENRLRTQQAPGSVSSSGPELTAPASPPPPPKVQPLAPGQQEPPLTPLTPSLPAQSPET